MSAGVPDPRWLDRTVIDAMHVDLVREHGGHPAVRDEKALEWALARPRSRAAVEPTCDLAALAAVYGRGLATSRAYADGNKRISFAVMYAFLGLNGRAIVASEPEVVQLMRDLASGIVGETELAAWLRAHTMDSDG